MWPLRLFCTYYEFLSFIQNEVQKPFDQKADDFTLEKIIELGFDQFSEQIGDVSGAATQELKIELGLKEISDMWESTELDIGPYKDKGHFKLK